MHVFWISLSPAFAPCIINTERLRVRPVGVDQYGGVPGGKDGDPVHHLGSHPATPADTTHRTALNPSHMVAGAMDTRVITAAAAGLLAGAVAAAACSRGRAAPPPPAQQPATALEAAGAEKPTAAEPPSTPTRLNQLNQLTQQNEAIDFSTPDVGRGRAIREALRAENTLLREKIKELETKDQQEVLCIDDGTEQLPKPTPVRRGSVDLAITPGDYKDTRGEYPRRCDLAVLAGHADKIRVYDPDHLTWCVDQFLGADPDLGGEETLDTDLAPGVRRIDLAAIVPSDEENCGACAISAPGVPVGPIPLWMKTTNTDGGFGGTRGRSEWLVPEDCSEDCCVLFLHGGSYMWYSGVDEYYRPLVSRIAKETGMPVLSIDYRMAPEWKAPTGICDALDALVWMDQNGPQGPRKARKIFVAGDSSGGGMCLALILAATNGIPGVEGKEKPPDVSIAGAVAICPLTDLTYDFKRTNYNSYKTRIWDEASRTGDAIFTDSHGNLLKDQLDRQERIRAYAGDGDLRADLLSPLWAKSYRGLPPIMLYASTRHPCT